MELRHLRYFVAVAEELHFSKAAERLHITPPSLTQQIQALEAELGARLLDRTKRLVKLTDAGQRLLYEARATLQQAERTERIGKQAGRGEVGRIEIGYTTSAVTSGVTVHVLSAYRELFDQVELRLHRMDTPRQFEYMLEGRIDIGFIRSPTRYPIGLTGFTLARQPIRIALPQNHPLAAQEIIRCADLADESFILPKVESEIGYDTYIGVIAEQGGFTPRIAQRNTDYVSAIALVGIGIGLAAVPESLVNVRVPGVCYRQIDVNHNAEMGLLFRRSEHAPAVPTFIDTARKLARAHQQNLLEAIPPNGD